MAYVFAYGSLIFRPGFVARSRARARCDGLVRRLYQGSPDHRGTEALLGRVATLVEEPHGHCDGVAWEVDDEAAPALFRALDERERGGYERAVVKVARHEPNGARVVDATTWIARAGNGHWLGPASDEAIAARVRVAVGPSGTNASYVLALRDALRAEGVDDPHVEAIAKLVEAR